MATYLQFEQLARNADWQMRCKWALRIAAFNVVNESAGTANHAARLAYANTVLQNTSKISDLTLSYLVLQNSTIQANMVSSLDSDIQFQVNSIFEPTLMAVG
jgi:hypothetical protein